jgi:hypothetical protein
MVPLNVYTIGGGGLSASAPQYIIPSTVGGENMVDGWFFKNTVASSKIQWGSGFLDLSGNYSLQLKSGINQVYFTAYINAITTTDNLPFLTLYTYKPGDFYTEKVTFVPSVSVTKPGYYTFVANISGNNNVDPAYFNSINIPMNFNKQNSILASSPSTTYNTLNDMPVLQPVYYITVQTNSASALNSVSLILTNLFVETNNTNSLIPSGTYCYTFSNSVVSNQFLYTSLNNLYNQLYQSNIISTVFPGSTA